MNIRIRDDLVVAGSQIRIGRINAVCGRNNSGKSTLLRTLESGKIEVAEPLSIFTHAELSEAAEQSMRSEYPGNRHGAAERVAGALVKFAANGGEITSGANEAIRDVSTGAFDPERSSVLFNFNQFIQRLTERLEELPRNRSIVPAKRMLRDEMPIGSNNAPRLDGEGIIEHLFRLQNHRTDRVGMDLLSELESAFEQVTAGYKFEIDLSGKNQLFLHFRLGDGELISAANCGMGLQDVLIMLFAAIVGNAQWVIIEEPENHLHPAMQRELLRFLSTIHSKTFFFATHSSIFLDQTFVDNILQCEYRDQKIHVTDETSKSSLLADLGYSVVDNLTADVILWVEGPHDKEAIEEIIAMLPPRPDKAIRIWSLGGDIMDQQDFATIKQNFNVRVLIDRESNPASRKIRARVVKKCGELGIPCVELERYAIENYYSIDAYRSVFKSQVKAAEIQPNVKVEKQLCLDPKKSTRELVRQTTLKGFEGTDLLRFVMDAFS